MCTCQPQVRFDDQRDNLHVGLDSRASSAVSLMWMVLSLERLSRAGLAGCLGPAVAMQQDCPAMMKCCLLLS